jgi:hypothetical protein
MNQEKDIQPGDYYKDCAFHACLCTHSTDAEVDGISLIDGSSPRSCDIGPCGVRKLSLEECLAIRKNGPIEPENRERIPQEKRWWIRETDPRTDCDFCHRTRDEVDHIITGHPDRPSICSECVELCVKLLQDNSK